MEYMYVLSGKGLSLHPGGNTVVENGCLRSTYSAPFIFIILLGVPLLPVFLFVYNQS